MNDINHLTPRSGDSEDDGIGHPCRLHARAGDAGEVPLASHSGHTRAISPSAKLSPKPVPPTEPLVNRTKTSIPAASCGGIRGEPGPSEYQIFVVNPVPPDTNRRI